MTTTEHVDTTADLIHDLEYAGQHEFAERVRRLVGQDEA